MSDSLHTKYRPQSFADVAGHEKICGAFHKAITKGLSRTFLLIGPSGTGKTTLARIALATAGCRERDMTEIDAATYTGIDDMRALTSGLMYKPLGANTNKGIIIDEAHALSKPAWNSLLKAIEEPRPWVFWCFCTTEPSRIPATIKTRCTTFDLKPVPFNDIFDLIRGIAKEEEIFPKEHGHIKGILELCAREAKGSPRQAIVNLGTCSDAKNREEAAELLKSAHDSAEAVDLARALLRGAGWAELQRLLGALKDMNPESIRIVVVNYCSAVALNAKSEKVAGPAIEIIDAFRGPYHSGEGIAPLIVACGQVSL